MAQYDPEVYWSKVAQLVELRGQNFVAGDDVPFFKYKRRKFLRRFLDSIDFGSKVVLEVGCGPGGNLRHIATSQAPKKLLGADISASMVELATRNLSAHQGIELTKIDGANLPYPDRSVDICFTVTVLQHNTDAAVFRKLVRELCRVCSTLILMEDIGSSPSVGGEGDWIGRRVAVYESACAEFGFQLSRCEFLNTAISRAWHERVFNFYKRRIAPHRHEGERIPGGVRFVLALPLPVTRILDDIFVENENFAMMIFRRI